MPQPNGPQYGTSNQQIAQLAGMIEASRSRSGGTGGSTAGATDMSEMLKGELEQQRRSKVGTAIQKATIVPGMALSTVSRMDNLDAVIAKAVSKISKARGTGAGAGGDVSGLTDAITKMGGLGYLGTSGVLNVPRQKQLAYEQQHRKQLGATGTASSAFSTLSLANRAIAAPRVASMVYGGGMPSSLQGAMGMYDVGKPMAKAAAGAAGVNLPGAMTSGFGGMMTGMAPMIAAQMGLGMMKAKKMAKITAQRSSGGTEEAKFSFSKSLDAQINMLAARGQLQPSDQLQIQIMKWIEAHTSVLPEMWADQKYLREEKEKGVKGAGDAYTKATTGISDGGIISKAVGSAEGFMSRTVAKYDVFGQLFNFLSTGKLPKDFQEELGAAYSTGSDRKEWKKTAKERGIGIAQSRLLEMTSQQIIDMSPSYEIKMLNVLGASFDIQRLSASELLAIRRTGFGIPDTAIKSDDYERSAIGKIWDVLKSPVDMLTNIPGVNALWNMLKLPFTVGGKVRGAAKGIWGAARGVMLGGEETQEMLESEETLRKKAGIYKSPQEMANEYMGRGLPDIMEEMRSVGWRQVQELTNIYGVLFVLTQQMTGITHKRDERTYNKQIQKGVWSYTAGKYLDEKGLEDQHKQDRDRMQLALEGAFKGTGMDRIGWLVNKLTGAGGATVEERLSGAAGMVRGVEAMPYDMASGGQRRGGLIGALQMALAAPLIEIGQEMTLTPEEVMETAMYRQRGVKGRGRARVVPGWFGAEQARKQMEFEQDIWPQLQRKMMGGLGGVAAGAGAVGLGGAASVLSGGALLPLLLMGGLGGAAGAIPPNILEFMQTQKTFEGLSGEDIVRMSAGFAEMPDMFEAGDKSFIKKYLKNKLSDEAYKKLGVDDPEFFTNINNLGFIQMALQNKGGTLAGMGAEINGEIFRGGKGIEKALTSPETRMGTISDLYQYFIGLTDTSPLPVRLAEIRPELSARYDFLSMRKKRTTGSKATIYDFPSPTVVSSDGEEKVASAGGMAKGGYVTKDGVTRVHAGEAVVPRGMVGVLLNLLTGTPEEFGSSLKGELGELKAKAKETKVLKWMDSVLSKLGEIDENTEDVTEKGIGKKSKKKKEKGSFDFSSVMSYLPLIIPAVLAMLGGVAGGIPGGATGAIIGGGVGIGAGMLASKKAWDLTKTGVKTGAKKALPYVGKAARWAGRGIGGAAKAVGAAGLTALTGAAGLGVGYARAQGKYGDPLGEELSVGQKIGLGAGTGLKWATLGMIDVDKMTGTSAVIDQVKKSRAQTGKIKSKTTATLEGNTSPDGRKLYIYDKENNIANFMQLRYKKLVPSISNRYGWVTLDESAAEQEVTETIKKTTGKVVKKFNRIDNNLHKSAIRKYEQAIERGDKEYIDHYAQQMAAWSDLPPEVQVKMLQQQEGRLKARAGDVPKSPAAKTTAQAMSKDNEARRLNAKKREQATKDKRLVDISVDRESKKLLEKRRESDAVMTEVRKKSPSELKRGALEQSDTYDQKITKVFAMTPSVSIPGLVKLDKKLLAEIDDAVGMDIDTMGVYSYAKRTREKFIKDSEKNIKKTKDNNKRKAEGKKLSDKGKRIGASGAAGMAAAGGALGVGTVIEPGTTGWGLPSDSANAGDAPKSPTTASGESKGMWGKLKSFFGFGDSETADEEVPGKPSKPLSRRQSRQQKRRAKLKGQNEQLRKAGRNSGIFIGGKLMPEGFSTEGMSMQENMELASKNAAEMKAAGIEGPIWPGSTFITSPFGPRKTKLKGASTFHRGVDMRANDVGAFDEGTVGGNIGGEWGAVEIFHPNGAYTRYLHLGSIKVKPRDRVVAGQKIGIAGNKGPIPGMKKHLHFEIRDQDDRAQDPELAFSKMGKGFSPSYASDIAKGRQLSSKLAGIKLNANELMEEGAEAAGFFSDKYDPSMIRSSMADKIEQINSDRKIKETVAQDGNKMPMAIPLPMPGTGEGRVADEKQLEVTDPVLDTFIEKLFVDCAFEFNNRYKNYAYNSNVGHVFS